MRATVVVTLIVMLSAMFLPQALQYFRAPAGTQYAFAEGFIPDYYQYLSWIKSGMEGHVLLESRYTSTQEPSALVHPLFSVTGMVAGLFGLGPPIAYLVLRLIAFLIFFWVLYVFIKTLFPSKKDRIISLLLILFGTGLETIPWSGHFAVISKYSLPPHHLLALAAWMGIIMSFARPPLAKLVVLGWILALLNPSIFLFAMIFLAIGAKKHIGTFILFLISVSPIIFYNVLTLRYVAPWSIMYERMLHFNPPTSLIDYLLSLSPLLPLSLLGAWKMRNSILIAWAYLPILLFPLVGILPINYSRLFQTYQYIPITLFAVLFIRSLLASQGDSLQKFFGGFFVIALIAYGVITYVTTLSPQLAPRDLSFYNVFVPKPLLAAFRFLDALPNERVVLSGEYVSQMIPAFTKHRAVIGRDDVVSDYYPLRDRAFAFLDGRMTEAEALKFVQEQKIDYVIFGVDTKPRDQLPTKTYRFLKPVFTDGIVSVTLRQ